MVVIFYSLEIEHYKVLKLHENSSSYPEKSAPSFKCRPTISAAV